MFTFFSKLSANFKVFISFLFLSEKRLSWSADVPYKTKQVYKSIMYLTHRLKFTLKNPASVISYYRYRNFWVEIRIKFLVLFL